MISNTRRAFLIALLLACWSERASATMGAMDFVSAPTNNAETAALACAGDCNGDGQVTVDELLTLVNIALGSAAVTACDAGDTNHDGTIGIDEILAAVDNALNGCGSSAPTATPVNTSTPTPTPSPAPPRMVVVGPHGALTFSPADLSVHVGETVQWVWASGGHNVVGGDNCTADGQFCSPNDTSCDTAPTSPPGTTYTHTFTAAGTYPYFCSVHCGLGMVGTVTVQ